MRSLLAVVLSVVVVACGSAGDPDTVAGSQSTEPVGAEIVEGDPAGDTGDVGDPGDLADTAISVADETIAVPEITSASVGASMRATATVNLRSSPSTSASVLLVIPSGSPVDVLAPTPQAGFLNVRWNGTAGWAHAAYLEPVGSNGATAPVDIDGAPSRDNALARAQTSVGFSYWWGGGAWLASGATSSNKGSCTGNCPSCSHAGKYGADCSGMIAKAWQFGTKALEVNSHPYGTIHFVNDAPGKWSTVSRGSIKKGDALVYNTNGAGHIALFAKGDPWGASTVYECRSCSYGCVYNTRSFTSSYKAIRRAGF